MRLIAVLLLSSGLLAACGSTGQPSGTATGSANSRPGGSDPALQLARCMRAHGVSNFPDPRPGGGGIQLGPGVNPQSPAFQSAKRACKEFFPDNGGPPATSASDRAAALKLSRCMRSHGVPQFPDPAFSPPRNARAVLVMGGMVFVIPASIDPNSPAFQHASHACGFGLP
jgi:hypothetical protein